MSFEHPFPENRKLYLERVSVLYAGCGDCGQASKVLDKKHGVELLKKHTCPKVKRDE